MAQAPPWEGLGGPHCGGTRSFPQASVRRGRHARTVQIVGEVSAPGDKDSKDSTSAGGLTGGGAGPETAAPRAEAGRAAPPVPPHRTAPRPLTACAPAAVTVLKKPPGPRPRDDERVGAAHAVTAGPRLPLPRATCNASRQGGLRPGPEEVATQPETAGGRLHTRQAGAATRGVPATAQTPAPEARSRTAGQTFPTFHRLSRPSGSSVSPVHVSVGAPARLHACTPERHMGAHGGQRLPCGACCPHLVL